MRTLGTLSLLTRVRHAALAACLFVFVVGANLATLDRFGSDMPDWDQWDAEGLNLFAPWHEQDHFIAHLFEPHNEHRVVLTKLQNFAAGLANGQWDARLECVLNALLHGAIALGLWRLARRWVAPPWQAACFVTIAALYGLPLAWQNLLGGFHSQQYWLTALSFAAMLLLPFRRAGSLPWWLGVVAATLALGSMGSGFLAALVVIGLVLWRWLRRELTPRDTWPTLLVGALLIAAGLLTRVEVPYHQYLRAKSLHDFIFTILRSLEWPLRDHDWAGALLWAPWLVVAVGLGRDTWILRRKSASAAQSPHRTVCSQSMAPLAIVGLGAWVQIQLVATAYVRGVGGDYPASRYMDTLIFATAVNGLALGWLLSRGASPTAKSPGQMASTPRNAFQRPPVDRWAKYALATAWFLALAIGLNGLVRRNVGDELPSTKSYFVQAESHLRSFLATNDPAELVDPIPYPSASSLLERLAHRSLREILPQSVRPALQLKPANGDHEAATFMLNRATQRQLDVAPRAGLAPQTPALASHPTWGSYNEAGAANIGEWVSAPLTAPLEGWLKFETAGNVGERGVSIELRDAKTGAVLSTVRPTKVPGNTWRSAYVRAPRRPFVVFAKDSDAQRWLAFSAPVEMGSLSYVAWQLTKNGLLLAKLAVAAAFLLALLGLGAGRSIGGDDIPRGEGTPPTNEPGRAPRNQCHDGLREHS